MATGRQQFSYNSSVDGSLFSREAIGGGHQSGPVQSFLKLREETPRITTLLKATGR